MGGSKESPHFSREDPPKPFELWRMDDYGNKLKIRAFASEEEAKVQRDIFEARGHKQAYWIEVTDQSAEENNTGEKKD